MLGEGSPGSFGVTGQGANEVAPWFALGDFLLGASFDEATGRRDQWRVSFWDEVVKNVDGGVLKFAECSRVLRLSRYHDLPRRSTGRGCKIYSPSSSAIRMFRKKMSVPGSCPWKMIVPASKRRPCRGLG